MKAKCWETFISFTYKHSTVHAAYLESLMAILLYLGLTPMKDIDASTLETYIATLVDFKSVSLNVDCLESHLVELQDFTLFYESSQRGAVLDAKIVESLKQEKKDLIDCHLVLIAAHFPL